MKKFVFVTPLTPKRLLTPVRKKLFDIYLKALENQSYKEWQVLLIGEEDKEDGKFIYLKSNEESKLAKLKVAYEYLSKQNRKPDYLIRLDDDDVISPNALNMASKLEFDCFVDKYHTFIEIITLKLCQSKRNWFPNSVIHKFEHAISKFPGEQSLLFMLDHSQTWHYYYSTKNVVFASQENPIYFRMISPTTVTSGQSEKKEIDWEQYNVYLNSFGFWKNNNLKQLSTLKMDLFALKSEGSSFKIKQKNWLRKRINANLESMNFK